MSGPARTRLFPAGLGELAEFMPLENLKQRVEEFSKRTISSRHERLCAVFMELFAKEQQSKMQLPQPGPADSDSAPDTPDMQEVRKPKETNFKKLIGFLASAPERFSLAENVTKFHRRKLSADLSITRTLKWTTDKGDALLAINASELVLRVALFEAFLQEIHRHALQAKPQLLGFVKPTRAVPLTKGPVPRRVRKGERQGDKPAGP